MCSTSKLGLPMCPINLSIVSFFYYLVYWQWCIFVGLLACFLLKEEVEEAQLPDSAVQWPEPWERGNSICCSDEPQGVHHVCKSKQQAVIFLLTNLCALKCVCATVPLLWGEGFAPLTELRHPHLCDCICCADARFPKVSLWIGIVFNINVCWPSLF